MGDLKPYLLALAGGRLGGAIYGIVHVRSPAPPVVALVGLLGILLGEQIPPLAKRLFAGEPVNAAVLRETCGEHVLGPLPGRREPPA